MVIQRRRRGPVFTSPNQHSSHDLWDKAIADALEMIEEETAHIVQLRHSVGALRRLRDSGATFLSGCPLNLCFRRILKKQRNERVIRAVGT